jgi:hypothetical protein
VILALLFLVPFVPSVRAHSDTFELFTLSANPAEPDELWGVVDGWGLVHSTDGGGEWGWLCEEAIGSTSVYDVLAWRPNVALVGTVDGLIRVGEDCTGTSVGDLPEGFVLRLARRHDEALVALIGPESGGVYRCDDDACVATSLVGPGYYPKSLWVDGDTAWVTVVHTGAEDGLRAELWRSDDGAVFSEVHAWPDGDVDPRVIHAAGDTVYAWLRPRSDAAVPGFARSTDGGTTFTTTFTTGYYTDSTPGVLVLDGGATVLVGSRAGARTWVSRDGGASFEEQSLDLPALKCGLSLPGRGLVCSDHLVDGFDVAETADGVAFTPVLCLEEVEAAACAEAACEAAADAWRAAAATGGGRCAAPEDSGAAPEPDPCGCASAGMADALLPLLAGWVAGLRRRAARG